MPTQPRPACSASLFGMSESQDKCGQAFCYEIKRNTPITQLWKSHFFLKLVFWCVIRTGVCSTIDLPLGHTESHMSFLVHHWREQELIIQRQWPPHLWLSLQRNRPTNGYAALLRAYISVSSWLFKESAASQRCCIWGLPGPWTSHHHRLTPHRLWVFSPWPFVTIATPNPVSLLPGLALQPAALPWYWEARRQRIQSSAEFWLHAPHLWPYTDYVPYPRQLLRLQNADN